MEDTSRFEYHQGVSNDGPSVQWSQDDNRYYQNATVRTDGNINVYANNVVIENQGQVYSQQYQPVQEVAPAYQYQAPVQRVQYVQDCGYYSNGCYGRDRGADVAAEIFGGVVGGIIGGAIINGGRRYDYDRGYDRGYGRGYGDGYYDRGYYDRGDYYNRGGYNGGYYNRGGYDGGYYDNGYNRYNYNNYNYNNYNYNNYNHYRQPCPPNYGRHCR
jgi:hypothetical protein